MTSVDSSRQLDAERVGGAAVGSAGSRRYASDICFVVLGRFPMLLSASKVWPIAVSGVFRRILVFRDSPGVPIEGVEYVTLPQWLRGRKLSFGRRIARRVFELGQLVWYATRLRPHVIQGFNTLPKGLNAVVAARFVGARVVVSVVGGKREVEAEGVRLCRGLWRAANIGTLRYCDLITTKGTQDNRYLVSRGFRPERVVTFNGAIDVERWDAASGNEPRDIDILFVGTFSERKGPDRALDVVRKLREAGTFVRAAFLGHGPLFDEIVVAAGKYGLSDSVSFHGYVADPSEFQRRAKLLIMPSRAEGLSTAMLESMACGCVPVVSAVDNTTDAALDGYNAAVIADYRDTSAFAEACRSLLASPAHWAELSHSGATFVRQHYSISAQARDYRGIVELLPK